MIITMRFFYVLLVLAIVLDLIIMPWFFSAAWMLKFVLALLPLYFLFFKKRALIAVFAIVLIYLRLTSFFNLGLLFLSLIAFLFFERWFLTTFFQKTAWQTSVFSCLGVIIFYVVLFLLVRVFTSEIFYVNWNLTVSVFLTALASLAVNLSLKRFMAQD